MRLMAILVLATLVASCSDVAPPPTRSAAAQQRYEQLIAGKVAQAPVNCLPSYRTDDMIRIDDSTVAFRDGRRVYVAHMRGSCTGLASEMNTLVTKEETGPGPCTGDIARVVDPASRMLVGSCTWGNFTPYVPFRS